MSFSKLFHFLESSPHRSGLLSLSGSVVDFRTLVFGLCLCERDQGWATLFCKLLGDTNFVPSLRTLIGFYFVENFPMATQKLAVYFLKLILHATWHFRKMTSFERVACTARNAISLFEFSFHQACSKKFQFWRRQLKLGKLNPKQAGLFKI